MHPAAKIHPVILAVPEADRRFSGREKLAALRRHARHALALSARFSGVSLGPLEKNAHGAPLPSNGIHWSLTHKQTYVAAVTAPRPVGIDVERIRPCSQGLYQRLASAAEWNLAPTQSLQLFFRFWTAKEAVLKAVGKGLTGLSDCRISAIVDHKRLQVTYAGTLYRVTHFWIDSDHLVTVTADDADIAWHLATTSSLG